MYLDKRYFGELYSESKACCDGEDGQYDIMPPSLEQMGHLGRAVYDFYRRGGNWRFRYRPGEVWCRDCLIEQESLDETSSESSDTESSEQDADMESSDNEEEEEEEEDDMDDASDISLD